MKRILREGIISIFEKFNILDHTATVGGLKNDILRMIDSMPEDSADEDLEEDLEKEFSRVWNKELSGQCDTLVALNVARHFANWQKLNDEHLIWKLSHANYEKGAEYMKQQMLKEAVEARVSSRPNDYGGYMPQVVVPVSYSLKEGEKVRVLVFKEDEKDT